MELDRRWGQANREPRVCFALIFRVFFIGCWGTRLRDPRSFAPAKENTKFINDYKVSYHANWRLPLT